MPGICYLLRLQWSNAHRKILNDKKEKPSLFKESIHSSIRLSGAFSHWFNFVDSRIQIPPGNPVYTPAVEQLALLYFSIFYQWWNCESKRFHRDFASLEAPYPRLHQCCIHIVCFTVFMNPEGSFMVFLYSISEVCQFIKATISHMAYEMYWFSFKIFFPRNLLSVNIKKTCIWKLLNLLFAKKR